jgi:hypothetical protein
LSAQVEWEAVHAAWAHEIMRHLHAGVPPPRYAARTAVHFGRLVAVAVAAIDRQPGGRAVATAPSVYAPPEPPLTALTTLAAEGLVEVQVRKPGGRLVAAVELVSEANKDRPDRRHTFAVKCASYLQAGVAVIVVDAVTSYRADLHAELIDLLGLAEPLAWASPAGLSAVVYRAVEAAGPSPGDGPVRLDVWPHPRRVGDPLPTVPLWLDADLAVPLDLDATNAAAWAALRMDE